jgi:hypothetical protein
MLRHILLAALIAFSSSAAHADVLSDSEEHIMPAGDRWTPWPWSMAQPFPWNDIRGMWKVQQDDYISYFALKVVRPRATGMRQLQVKQIDGQTCKVIATGVGIEKGSRVLAQMTSKSGVTYRVHLTSFDQKDSPQEPLKGTENPNKVMVLSIGDLDQKGLDHMAHMQILKVSRYLDLRICTEDLKK